jgi:hypothetical protein
MPPARADIILMKEIWHKRVLTRSIEGEWTAERYFTVTGIDAPIPQKGEPHPLNRRPNEGLFVVDRAVVDKQSGLIVVMYGRMK